MGFSYNDVASKEMGIKARLTSWQVSGRLRNFTTTVPRKYGVADFGADMDYREISIACNIFPKHTFSALVAALDDVSAWLDPTQVQPPASLTGRKVVTSALTLTAQPRSAPI